MLSFLISVVRVICERIFELFFRRLYSSLPYRNLFDNSSKNMSNYFVVTSEISLDLIIIYLSCKFGENSCAYHLIDIGCSF